MVKPVGCCCTVTILRKREEEEEKERKSEYLVIDLQAKLKISRQLRHHCAILSSTLASSLQKHKENSDREERNEDEGDTQREGKGRRAETG